MCGLALLLLVEAVFMTQGEVITPPQLIAEVGYPFMLGCNITTKTDESVLQVRWSKKQRPVLVYQQTVPIGITHQDLNVELSISQPNASYITIKSVRPEDEGCYSCIFDVFPKGKDEGVTCIGVTAKVRPEGNKTAVSGKPTTLSCSYSLPEAVHQVLWKKTAEQGDTTTVAYYTKYGHHHVHDEFQGRVSLSRTLGYTQLTIQSVRTEDEACYTCEFSIFPEGPRRTTSCLSVYVLPKPEVSYVTSPSGVIEANCTTQSRPAADITWNVAADNRTLGPPISSAYDQGDGTTMVTSTLMFQSGLLSELSVRCIVHHQGLDKPLSVALQTHVGPATVILLSVCGVAAILLLCLCVCLCKCFICTDD
ncbi:poliovirus receptor homolog [Aulostomus maculatus]